MDVQEAGRGFFQGMVFSLLIGLAWAAFIYYKLHEGDAED